MGWIEADSDLQACTVGSPHTLFTLTVPTGGKSYILRIDYSALASGERLLVELEAKTRTSDTRRKLQPSALLVGGYDQKVIDLPFVVAQASNEVLGKLTQLNGTGRDILWALLEG